MQGTNAIVFKDIFEHYVKIDDLVLDCTCGKKRFYDDININKYRIVFSDIRPVGDVVANYFSLPFKSSIFDVLIFDPPYTQWHLFKFFDVHGGISDVYQKDDYNLQKSKTFKFADMDVLKCEFARILKNHGLLVFKIQDEKCAFAVPIIVDLCKTDFKFIDLIIYVFNDVPIWVKIYRKRGRIPRTSYRNHAYFMVFEKR